jgi:hypothetical protein
VENPFKKHIDSLRQHIENGAPRISHVSGKLGEALVKRRIFNRGIAADGTQIGKYSKWWTKVRKKKKRQTKYVDLQFTGDLFRSIELGMKGEKAILGITNFDKARVAKEMEKLFGKPIFALSTDEVEKVSKTAARELGLIIVEYADSE